MSANPAYALVPVIGGLTLVLGTALALLIDRRDLLRAENPVLPVYIRYVSQATLDLRKRPHWIFFAAAVVFCPCIMVSAVWQSQLEDGTDSIAINGIACGASAVLLAALPMGKISSTVVHSILATALAITGLNYVYGAQRLADDQGKTGLAIFRRVVWVFGNVGGAVACTTVYPAVTATLRLFAHQEGKISLKANEIKRHRSFELALAVAQVLIGLSIGVSLVSASADVVDVSNNDSDKVLAVGLSSAIGSVLVFCVCILVNERLRSFCQAELP